MYIGKSFLNDSNPQASAPLKVKIDCMMIGWFIKKRLLKKVIWVTGRYGRKIYKFSEWRELKMKFTWSSSPTTVMCLWDARILSKPYCMALVSWNSSTTIAFHDSWHSTNTSVEKHKLINNSWWIKCWTLYF